MCQKILIIDDDKALLEVLETALVLEKFEVIVIDKVANIFDLINIHQPNLIIVDYILQGINGGELCHQIKCDGRTSNLPVIIISAYHRVINSLGHYGCNAFI